MDQWKFVLYIMRAWKRKWSL